jgi:GTP-binding protein EngB required for normal cell division
MTREKYEREARQDLNEFQARSLSVTCQCIDKIIADIEHVLNTTTSKVAFPKFVNDITLAQRRTIEDYLARIRAQLVRILEGQRIPKPEATIPASRAVFTALLSTDISVEELRPPHMRGYGELPAGLATELEGIYGELHGLVSRVNQYLLLDPGQDLRNRLERLGSASTGLELLTKVERIVSERGLVEFRSTLASIADQLEDQSLEIAVFGRVSSGKSSLLNAILGENILPVGVTPITAIPTRLRYHQIPSVTVCYAERPSETLDIVRLAEFASEGGNPKNRKRVTRVVVNLPSWRLREGVTLVDTPGLGSLATTGAAEALTYLPNCDLGVVLVDAGSTITREDLETIQALYQAGIPVQVLLSKADLLTVDDIKRMAGYVHQSILEEYGIDLPVYPVSAMEERRETLDRWFETEILPLYEHCRELKLASLKRKVVALREAVVAALAIHLRKVRELSDTDHEKIREIEASLRKATGRVTETRDRMERDIRALGGASPLLLERAAIRLAGTWTENSNSAGGDLVVRESILSDVQEKATFYSQGIESLVRDLHSGLACAAKALGFSNVPPEDEFLDGIRGMPVFDFSIAPGLQLSPTLWRFLGKGAARASARHLVTSHLEKSLSQTLAVYSGVLGEWVSSVLRGIEKQFSVFADAYRAQAERAESASRLSDCERRAILSDLRELGEVPAEVEVFRSDRKVELQSGICP